MSLGGEHSAALDAAVNAAVNNIHMIAFERIFRPKHAPRTSNSMNVLDSRPKIWAMDMEKAWVSFAVVLFVVC